MSAASAPAITSRIDGPVQVTTINRPDVANALDRPAAAALADAMRAFEQDDDLAVAVLTGSNGTFCAGADLKAALSGDPSRSSRVEPSGDGPLGPTRMTLSKPVLAAVEGHAVAGGLELALWCDMRIASTGAIFGVYCRRWGIPLMDGGTIRLPRLLGHSRALDLILTGRPVGAQEAFRIGLANRLTEPGEALTCAVALAHEIAAKPQAAMRHDRASSYEQWQLSPDDAIRNEYDHGAAVLAGGQSDLGLREYATGAWRRQRHSAAT
jgi:enoyl-CoA hydratase